MNTRVRTINSLAPRVPSAIAKELTLTQGASELFGDNDGPLVMTPGRPRWKLSDLLVPMPASQLANEVASGDLAGMRGW